MRVSDLIAIYTPESHGRNEDWTRHAARLWKEEAEYMSLLVTCMLSIGSWVYNPVIIHDGVVQDGHHRIVVAMYLDPDLDVPIEEVEVSG